MATFERIELTDFSTRPFVTFPAAPLLVTESCGRSNAMTIGWGGLGTLWSLPVTTTYVRTSRFTHQLLSCSALYSICWLPSDRTDAVALCGKQSGRTMDKLAACGLTLDHTEDGVPYLLESETVIACRKIHMAPIDMLAFTLDGLHDRCYEATGENTPHASVIGEVLAILQAVD